MNQQHKSVEEMMVSENDNWATCRGLVVGAVGWPTCGGAAAALHAVFPFLLGNLDRKEWVDHPDDGEEGGKRRGAD